MSKANSGDSVVGSTSKTSMAALATLPPDAFRFPAPVVMLFIAVAVKIGMAVPPQLQQGAGVVYKFFRTAVTYPLLFAIGVAMTPWDKLMAALLKKMLQVEQSSACADITVLADDGDRIEAVGGSSGCAGHARD